MIDNFCSRAALARQLCLQSPHINIKAQPQKAGTIAHVMMASLLILFYPLMPRKHIAFLLHSVILKFLLGKMVTVPLRSSAANITAYILQMLTVLSFQPNFKAQILQVCKTHLTASVTK